MAISGKSLIHPVFQPADTSRLGTITVRGHIPTSEHDVALSDKMRTMRLSDACKEREDVGSSQRVEMFQTRVAKKCE